jgi:metallo-beta-lactamase family protein
MSSKIKFLTGVSTVTGSNFLLTTGAGTNVLIDCGLVQGERAASEENYLDFGFDISRINALIISHSHLDHVGRIPKLVKEGYSGPIYSTPQTKELARIVLEDAVQLLAVEAKERGVEPLYSEQDVPRIFDQWKVFQYHEQIKISPELTLVLKDAGHILGSSMLEFSITEQNLEKKILFSGDLGNSPAPLLRDTENVGDVDYLVIESTYGDRNHEPKEQRVQKLEEVVKSTISRGGTLVIPAFSVDRTQVLLYELNNMVEKNRIPRVPVFVDSPMAIKSTEVYRKNSHLFNDKVQEQIAKGDDIFSFPHLEFTFSKNDSQDIDKLKGAKIILAGSGMSVGGRVVGHEAHYLPDERNTILLVGYQTAGSLGRRLADGAKKVNIHGQGIPVKAKIETLYGYSAHKDSDHLVEFVTTATERLKNVFVVMGEPKSEMFLAQRINNELMTKAIVPESGEEYEI